MGAYDLNWQINVGLNYPFVELFSFLVLTGTFFWPCFPKTMTRLDLNWYKTRFHVSSLFPIISPIFIFTEMVLIG